MTPRLRPGFNYFCRAPSLPFMSARALLRLLTLLLGSFYLGSVCELDAEECRQNYAKECHAYVAAHPGVDVPAAAGQLAIPTTVPAAPRWPAPGAAFFPPTRADRAWPRAQSPPPRPRRHLWCAVLQV